MNNKNATANGSAKPSAQATAAQVQTQKQPEQQPQTNLPAIAAEQRKDTTTQTPELSNTVISAHAKVVPNILQRIAKYHELSKVLEKREKIAEAIEQLDDFYIAPSGSGCNLKLTDSRNNTFAISHPSVIGEMVALAKGKLTTELSSIDAEFNFDIK